MHGGVVAMQTSKGGKESLSVGCIVVSGVDEQGEGKERGDGKTARGKCRYRCRKAVAALRCLAMFSRFSAMRSPFSCDSRSNCVAARPKQRGEVQNQLPASTHSHAHPLHARITYNPMHPCSQILPWAFTHGHARYTIVR